MDPEGIVWSFGICGSVESLGNLRCVALCIVSIMV